MKCPSCQFSFSDLRDLCPKCLLDVRSHKRAIGLPITYAHATYDQLLGKARRKDGEASFGLPGFLRSIFVGRSLDTCGEASNLGSENRAQGTAAEQHPVSVIEALLDTPLEPSLSSEEKKPLSSPPAPELPPQQLETFQQESLPEAEAQVEERFEPGLQPEMPVFPASKSPNAIFFRDEEERIDAIQERELSEVSSTDELFEAGYRALQREAEEGGFELATEQLRKIYPQDQAAFALLFDLSFDAIQDPTLEDEFQEVTPSTEGRILPAAELSEKLKQVEQELSRPLFSLKFFRGERGAEEDEAIMPELRERAPRRLQLQAIGVDSIISLILGLVATLFYIRFVDAEFREDVLGYSIFDDVVVVSAVGILAGLSMASFFVYPLLSYLFLGDTIGTKLLHLEVVGEEGVRVRGQHRFVRAATFPISLLFFVFLPTLFNRRCPHEYFSRTFLSVRPSEEGT